MNLYLDASALIKRYVAEAGSREVMEEVDRAAITCTSIISRAVVAAALARAARTGSLKREAAVAALKAFRADWPNLVRVQVTDSVVARADSLAWEYGLRGYDSVQLACASMWQDGMGERVKLATFDRQLWLSARRLGLEPFPDSL